MDNSLVNFTIVAVGPSYIWSVPAFVDAVSGRDLTDFSVS
jgi:hypothetical protein